MIGKIIKVVTFIPWIIYFLQVMNYRINIIEEKDYNKDKYFKYINKNFFSSINLKELVLFCIFIIFMQHENTMVLEILFPAFYLYLIIEFAHTLGIKCQKINNKWLLLETIIVILSSILYFVLSNHLYTTYIIMFSVSLLSSFIVYLFVMIYKLFCKKTIKK